MNRFTKLLSGFALACVLSIWIAQNPKSKQPGTPAQISVTSERIILPPGSSPTHMGTLKESVACPKAHDQAIRDWNVLLAEGRLEIVPADKYPLQWVLDQNGREQRMVADHLMVRLPDDGVPSSLKTTLASYGYGIRDRWDQHVLVNWDVPDGASPDLANHIARLQILIPGAHIEPDLQFQAASIPENEVLYPSDDQEDGLDVQWLYENGYRADGITVAVLDTGIHADHPDLADRIIPGYDFVDDDTDTADLNNHGSAMSAVIAANPDNQIGMAGLAPGSRILPVRILDASGKGFTSDGIKGIDYARSQGALIINASWGGMWLWSEELKTSIQAYIDSGGLFVCAAGNDHMDLRQNPNFPASYNLDGMIVVGGLYDNFSNRASGSNYGEEVVDILAPWTWNIPCFGCTLKDRLSEKSGTSISTAIVSAFAAIAKANLNEPDALALASRILETGILAPNATRAAEHPGYPNFERMFANFRPAIPEITGHTLGMDPLLYKVSSSIQMEVTADAEYAITGGNVDYVFDESNMTVTVSHADGTLFSYRIYSINGFTWYGPFRLFAVIEPPALLNPPGPYLEMSASSDPEAFEFFLNGSNPIAVQYETASGEADDFTVEYPENRFSIPTFGLPTGPVRFTVSNDFGELEYLFDPVWDNRIHTTKIPPVYEMLLFGDQLMAQTDGLEPHTWLFDGHTLTEYPWDFSWDGHVEHLGYDHRHPVFLRDNRELITFDGEGRPIKTDYKPEYRDEYQGVFDNRYIFTNQHNLRLVEPGTGAIEIIEYPNENYFPFMKIFPITNALIFATSKSDPVWRLGLDRQWSTAPELELYIFNQWLGLYSTGEYLFYFTDTIPGNDAEIRHSYDGINWETQAITLFPGWQVSTSLPFVYNGGIGFYFRPFKSTGPDSYNYYRFELGSPDPIPIMEAVPESLFMDSERPFSIGTTIRHGRTTLFKGNHYDPEQHNEARYYVTSKGYYRCTPEQIDYSGDLATWHKVVGGNGSVIDFHGGSVLVNSIGVYTVHGPWIGERIGQSFPGSNNGSSTNLEVVAGNLFVKLENRDTWYRYIPSSGTWADEEIRGAMEVNGQLVYSVGNRIFRLAGNGPEQVFQPEDVGLSGEDYPKVYPVADGPSCLAFVQHRNVSEKANRFYSSTNLTVWQPVERPGLQGRLVDYAVGRTIYSREQTGTKMWWQLVPSGKWVPKGQITENCLNMGRYFGTAPISGQLGQPYTSLRDRETLSREVYSLLPNAAFSGSSGWFTDEHLGWFYFSPDYPSYLLSTDHGWLHVAGNMDAGYLYDSELGWLFYHRGSYPNLYLYSSGEWLRYLPGSHSPRWFWSFRDNAWRSI